MTEKRYSDGTLAKWYYSQTNVISDGNNEYYLRNKESVKDFNYNELLGTNDLLDELNRLSDENEELKKDCSNLIDDNTEYVAEINQMHKENEQLKQQLIEKERMLDVRDKIIKDVMKAVNGDVE